MLQRRRGKRSRLRPLALLSILSAFGAGCSPKKSAAPVGARPLSGTSIGQVALLSLSEDSGKLHLTGVRQLPKEVLRPTTVPAATHKWSLHAASGQTLVSGTFQIRRTIEVPPGGPNGGHQLALNAQLSSIPFSLHVPWPAHGQHIEIDGIDKTGHAVPGNKLVWP